MNKEIYEWAKFIFMVVVIATCLFVIFIQFLNYKYKAEFLLQPCELCAKLNPAVSTCIEGCFIRKEKLFPDGKGGWRYENGTSYEGYVGSQSFNLNLTGMNLSFTE